MIQLDPERLHFWQEIEICDGSGKPLHECNHRKDGRLMIYLDMQGTDFTGHLQYVADKIKNLIEKIKEPNAI